MEPSKEKQFLQSQLFTLVVLQSVQELNKLNKHAQLACENAQAIAAAALDRLIAEKPELEVETQGMIAQFTEVPKPAKKPRKSRGKTK